MPIRMHRPVSGPRSHGNKERQGEEFRPEWLPSPACKVVLVTGPAGAGKTTYCVARAGACDVVIDLDECFVSVCGIHGHDAPARHLGAALGARNKLLAALSQKGSGVAYFIASCPAEEHQAWWAHKLRAEVVVIDPGESMAKSRVADHRKHLVDSWYAARGMDYWTRGEG